jgi:hypothetical protein
MSKTCFAASKEVCGDQGHGSDRFHVVPQAVEVRDEGWRSGPKPRDPEEANA